MALTHDQKVQIASTYAPILIFHPDEAYYPVRPETYLAKSALWQSNPATDRKADWGLPPLSFPRRPTIPKGGISLDPAQDDFLYPIHTEYLRRCEQVFEGGTRGDYEGDWNAIAVVVQKPAVLPWDPGGSFAAPMFVGYGVRLRGIAKDVAPDLFKQGMIILPWDQASKIGLHPRIFVTQGYHNNNGAPGDRDPFQQELLGTDIPELTCEATEAVNQAVSDVKKTLRDIGHTLADIGVTIAKVYAGASAGFGLLGFAGAAVGAIVGAVAGVAEALSTSSTDDVPSGDALKMLEREPGPPQTGGYGRVIKPSDVDDPLTHEATRPESATEVIVWTGDPEARLVDRAAQIFWPGDANDPGFEGRWGVRCEDDPLDRRSGITFPDFRRTLLNDLAVHLTKTDA